MTTSVETQECQDIKRSEGGINIGFLSVFMDKLRKKVSTIIHFQPPSVYFSLHLKLLVSFTLIFSVVFAIVFYWFYQFATSTALTRIQDELTATLAGGVNGVNVDELLALAHEGKQNAAGFTDDPRFQNQLNWLDTIHQIEPRAWPYIYIPGNQPGEIVYIVDLLARYEPLRANKFLITGASKGFSLASLQELNFPSIEARSDTYTNESGRWISAYAPIKDENAVTVAALGIDFQADYVDQIRQSILNNIVIAFLVTYLSLFIMVYLFSHVLTRPIVKLTQAAQNLSDYSQGFSTALNSQADDSQTISTSELVKSSDVHSTDEIDILANVLDGMTYRLAERTVELEKTNMLLKEIDRTKVGFIEVSGHELRTPLTLIKGYAQMLQQKSGENPEACVLIKGVLDGTNRLSEIVNNMLDVSKIDSKMLKVAPDNAVPISALIMKEQSTFQPALNERNLTFNVQEIDSLPPIQADPQLLSKVFYHLIMNAIKYTPDGGNITVSGHLIQDNLEAPEVEIVICDSGIGIAPEYHELVFEKFFQTGEVMLHSSGKTKFKGGGPGLGLAIVHGIIAAHAGRVWVESAGYSEETCPGSSFHVRLPVHMICQHDPSGAGASRTMIDAPASLPV